jgi:hypothetical protein
MKNFTSSVNSDALNESMFKKFGKRINFDKYTREQLEDARNKLRTEVNQKELTAGFSDLLQDDQYQQKKFMLGVLNTRIKEMLGESRLDEKAKSKKQQKFMGMVYAAKKGKKPASKTVAKAAKGMSKKAAKDYAETKHKGLPEKVKKKKATETVGRDMKGFLGNTGKGTGRGFDQSLSSTPLGQPDYEAVRRIPAAQRAGMKPAEHPKKPPRGTHGRGRPMPEDGQSLITKRDAKLSGGRAMEEYNSKGNAMKTFEARKKAAKDYDGDGKVESPTAEWKGSRDKAIKSAKNEPASNKRFKAKKAKNAPKAKAPPSAKKKTAGTKAHVSKPKITVGKKAMKESTIKENYKAILEGLRRYIREDEEGKAKDITAGSDMVNDFTSWMQRIGQYQTKSMIELSDSIRANFGHAESETFKNTVAPALQQALDTLTASRETLTQAVAVLAGEEQPQEMMGAEPNAEPMSPEAGPDSMNPEANADEFGASDAAAGGSEAAGREQRESREYRRAQKLAEAHSIISKLAR